MAKKNQKGRTQGTGRFVKLDHYLLNSPAWAALKPSARALYVLLSQRYNGSNNGHIGLGEREATKALNLSDKKATRRAFAELQIKGFIKLTKRGAFSLKVGKDRRASEWALTAFAVGNALPTKEFMRWGLNANCGGGKHTNTGEKTTPRDGAK